MSPRTPLAVVAATVVICPATARFFASCTLPSLSMAFLSNFLELENPDVEVSVFIAGYGVECEASLYMRCSSGTFFFGLIGCRLVKILAGPGERAFPIRVLLSETQFNSQINSKIRDHFRKRVPGGISLVPHEVDVVGIPDNHQLPKRRSFAGSIVYVCDNGYLRRLKKVWSISEVKEFIYDIIFQGTDIIFLGQSVQLGQLHVAIFWGLPGDWNC